jgi:hypothetical protein
MSHDTFKIYAIPITQKFDNASIKEIAQFLYLDWPSKIVTYRSMIDEGNENAQKTPTTFLSPD